MTEIIDLAKRWVEQDPDPETKAAGALLIKSGSDEELASHFGHRLGFGTAGMRGALGPGPNRMNASTVIRVTSAVGKYVRHKVCLLYTSPSPRDRQKSRMPSSA